MSANEKRVFYVRYLAHASYEDVMRQRPDVRLDRLDNDSAEAEAGPILANAHAYQIVAARDEIATAYHVGPQLLARTPNLLLVSSNGAGYDTVDVAACTAAGVLVVNQAGGNKQAVAEHVLGMMLCLAKRIAETDKIMRREADMNRNLYLGTEIHGKTIGIVGLGNVGTRVAEICRGLFAMRVLAYDPFLTPEEMARRGAEKVDLDDLMRSADYVSINCPLTERSRGMIGARQFALMQPQAYFITTARGFIHDEAALADALARKAIAGAGLDVWAKEPPPLDHSLLQFDNVIVSPHTAGVTREARANMGRIGAEQVLEALDGKRPPRIVNPDVLPKYAERFAKIMGFRAVL